MTSAEAFIHQHVEIGERDIMLDLYEEVLCKSIGCLASFIVRKHHDRLTDRGQKRLDPVSARTLARLVAEEVSVLVGPARSASIRSDLDRINDQRYPQEEC